MEGKISSFYFYFYLRGWKGEGRVKWWVRGSSLSPPRGKEDDIEREGKHPKKKQERHYP